MGETYTHNKLDALFHFKHPDLIKNYLDKQNIRCKIVKNEEEFETNAINILLSPDAFSNRELRKGTYGLQNGFTDGYVYLRHESSMFMSIMTRIADPSTQYTTSELENFIKSMFPDMIVQKAHNRTRFNHRPNQFLIIYDHEKNEVPVYFEYSGDIHGKCYPIKAHSTNTERFFLNFD